MERKNLLRLAFLLYVACLLFNSGNSVAGQIQPPQTFIGHKVGEDYKVARYEKNREYFQHVGTNSNRVNVRVIGLTTEGREMVIAEITDDAAPERIWQAMADQMKIADPRLIKDQEDE